MPSSRTPEGDENVCRVCGRDFRVDPSRPPGDAPCPHCGTLNWFCESVVCPSPIADRSSVQGRLVPCELGDPIPLLKSKLLVGRNSQSDIVLEFPNISARHCLLERVNGYWHVRDLRSRNGIKVNGIRCDTKWLLPGDEISIAKHRYEVQYLPPPDGRLPGGTDFLN